MGSKDYPWDNISSMVDIGSGTGAVSMPLAKMFPSLEITNQDLPGTLILAQKVDSNFVHQYAH